MANVVPWISVNPHDFTEAAGAGSSAGTAVGHLRQSAIDAQNRVAAEAAALQQRASEAQAELAQRNVLARMEMQARQDIAEKMRLHEQQQLEVQNAYHQVQTGLEQQRIAETAAVNRAKAEAAAGQLADETALAQHVAGGGKMVEGLMKYSRARPQFINALQQTVPAPEYAPKEMILGGQPVIYNPHEGGFKYNNAGKINVHRAIDKDNPDYGHITQTVSPAEAYQLAGTNAASLFPGGPPTAPIAPPSSQSPFKEGQKIREKGTGKLFIVRDGQPVPVDESPK